MRWRIGLGGRLAFAFLTVGVVSVCGAGFLVDRTVRADAAAKAEERLRYEVTMMGQMTASALFTPLDHGDTSLQSPVRDLAAAVQTHLSILTPDGFDVADSEATSDAQAKSEATEPEVVAALRDEKGVAVRGDGGMRRLWVAEAIRRDGQVLGIARASLPMRVIDEQLRAVRMRLLQAILGALAIGALFAMFLSVGIARPVRRLAAAARRIGAGDLGTRVNVPPGDEIGDLGKALNDMTASLQSMIDKLDGRNADMRRVLDTVEQGLVVASADGGIEVERSALIDVWFDSPAERTRLWDLFDAASQLARDSFAAAWEQIGDGFLPLEVSIDQLPKRITNGERIFALSYKPVAASSSEAQRVLVSIFDITSDVEIERNEEERSDLLELMGHALRDRGSVVDFLREADSFVAACHETANGSDVMRSLHTLKGNCGMQQIHGIAGLCHTIESNVAERGSISPEDCERLKTRWQAFRATVDAFLDAGDGIVIDPSQFAVLEQSIRAGAPHANLAELVANWRRIPLEKSLKTLGERAGALAERLGKGPIHVSIEHNDVSMESERSAVIFGALAHVVRNAIDHGIELGEDRIAAGKPEQATITLRAKREGNEFVIEVEDDGAGIRWSVLTAKLLALGLPAKARDDLVEGLFADGSSTAAEVSDVSGRGVGMGAVRATIEKLGGTVQIRSNEGRGTTVSCRVPQRECSAAPSRAELPKLPTRGSRASGIMDRIRPPDVP